MKLIIELDDDIAKGIRGENECEVEPREIVRSFQATISEAIQNGIPYDPSGDAISREALTEEMRKSINERYPKWNKPITVADIATLIFDVIDNAQAVERPQGDYETECNVLLSLEQIVRRSEGWEDDAIEAVHNAVQTAIKCMKGGAK